MKILHVISSANPVGGGPIEGVKQLGAILTGAGHRVEVASLDPPDARYLKECSLPVHPLGPPTSHYAFSSRFIPWLRANRSHYDAVVVNGIWHDHAFVPWCVLRNTEKPLVRSTAGWIVRGFKRTNRLNLLLNWFTC